MIKYLSLLWLSCVRVVTHPRTLLNVAGMLVGAAGIVGALAVQTGIAQATQQQIKSLGSNLVVIDSAVGASGVQPAFATDTITRQDADALNDPSAIPGEVQSAPTAGLDISVTALSRSWRTGVVGTTDAFLAVRGYSLAEGSFFSAADVSSAAPVAVIGQTIVNNLFAGDDPVGRILRINGHPFQVTGVFAQRGWAGSSNQDDVIAIPISTAWAYVLPQSAPRVQEVLIQAHSAATADTVAAEATQLLMSRHHITDPSQLDFQVHTQVDVVQSLQRVGELMRDMLAAIAVVALAIGGVGVATVMLATVGERAREIGIRRSVGASRTDIVWQFLAEGLVLTVLGIGLGLGVAVAVLPWIPHWLASMPTPQITFGAVALAVAVVLAVGLVTAAYPALRAARLEPSEALRRV